MIRRAIIVVLMFGAVATGILDLTSRVTPLRYYSEFTTGQTPWKLDTFQVVRGRLHVGFETTGRTVAIARYEQSLKDRSLSGGPPPVLRPGTLGYYFDRMGFYVTSFAEWAYVPYKDAVGECWCAKAITHYAGFGAPAWFVLIVLAVYPGGVLLRIVADRGRFRSRDGLCVACGYDLRGNTSGVCPECGAHIDHNSLIWGIPRG